MKSPFDAQRVRAAAQIKAKGESITWFKPGAEIDSATPWNPDSDADTSYTVVVVFTPGSSRYQRVGTSVSDSDTAISYLFGIMAALNLQFTPEYRDAIQRTNGDVYYVERADSVSPDGTDIIWKLEFQR